MSIRWCLFALLYVGTKDSMKEANAAKLEEYREYVALVSDVQEYYKVSSVFIAYPGNDENLQTTTLMLQLMRQFSAKQVLSLTLNYTGVARLPHQGRITRPLYVVLLNSVEHVEQFIRVSGQCEMSYPFWLLIFTSPRPEICGPRAKILSNFFHLRFDTEMIVKCHGSATLTEWYSLQEDRTSVEELATWYMDTGLRLKSNASVFERRRNLHGKLMRVATVKDSPFIAQGGFEKAGFFTTIFSELSSRLNFSITVPYEEDHYGMFNESSKKWSGVIGRLHANEADFGVAEFSMTKQRLDAVDFTLPIMLSRNQLYMKEPDGSILQWNAYFRVYEYDVWIVMELLYVFTSLVITFIRMKVKEKPLPPNHVSENYLCVWGLYCQQGMTDFPISSPLRIAYFSILVSSVILLAIYSACLISYLTLKNPSLPFTDLEGFVADGSYKLIAFKESSDYDFFTKATDVVLKKMMKMMADTESLPRTMMNGFRQACNDKTAFYSTEAIKTQINARISCDLVFVETGRIDSLGMTLKKKSPYTELINYHLQKFRDMGIMTRLRAKAYVKVNAVENKFVPTSLQGITTILVLLSVGAVLSLVILAVEIVTHRRQVTKQKRNLSQSTTNPEYLFCS